jgi:hypothetical protein
MNLTVLKSTNGYNQTQEEMFDIFCQIKMTLRFYFTPVRMAIIKKSYDKCW